MSQPPVNPPHQHQHPHPAPPPGGNQPPPDDDDDLRAAAQETLSDCEEKLETFRTNAGMLLNKHVDHTFGYFQRVLKDDSKPGDWLKDGIALWIGCYRTGEGIWGEAYKLYCPKK
jgi:hypothetical protein